MSWSYPELVGWLRAVGEPSRLRLLVLCAEEDLAVSYLARALAQSEPRVSRHLKILCDAGLLERVRQGQWVHYRINRSPSALSFVQGLLAQLDRSDAMLARDRERVRSGIEEAGGAGAHSSRLGRALREFVEAGRQSKAGRILVVGVEHLELLESSVALAGECTAIAHSRRAAQSARAFAERHGFACRVLLAGGAEGLTERDLLRVGGSFDAVLLDRLAMPDSGLPTLLALGRGALAPGGRLWLFERYAFLTAQGPPRRSAHDEKVVEHPLARLRRLLTDTGFTCERLSPIEADGEHVLAVLAAPTVQAASVPSAG
jgi:DNA-binding transcriptional ArsR family regulator